MLSKVNPFAFFLCCHAMRLFIFFLIRMTFFFRIVEEGKNKFVFRQNFNRKIISEYKNNKLENISPKKYQPFPPFSKIHTPVPYFHPFL